MARLNLDRPVPPTPLLSARYGDALVGLPMEQPSIRRPVIVAWPAQKALDEPMHFVIDLRRDTLATLPGVSLTEADPPIR